MEKLRVGIVFGGKSAEHEVSLQSAKNIVDAIDKSRFDVVLLGIDKQGQWHVSDASNYLLNADDPAHIALRPSATSLAQVPGKHEHQLIDAQNGQPLPTVDVIFPIVHGTLGEDGSLQGMLRVANLPFVGSDVLASAACMDKDVTKRLLRDAGLNIAPFITLTRANRHNISFAEVESKLGLPLFVKPANQGSSVGVSKVTSEEQYAIAVDLAFEFDHKVIVEQGIKGREIECAVLGNANNAKHETVDVPASNMKKSIAQILLDEGYIKSFTVEDDGLQGMIHITLKYNAGKEKVITGLRRVSKPGLRVYVGADELPRVLRGLGIAIISTSKGVMTDKAARAAHVGGEVLAFVW